MHGISRTTATNNLLARLYKKSNKKLKIKNIIFKNFIFIHIFIHTGSFLPLTIYSTIGSNLLFKLPAFDLWPVNSPCVIGGPAP